MSGTNLTNLLGLPAKNNHQIEQRLFGENLFREVHFDYMATGLLSRQNSVIFPDNYIDEKRE